MTQELRELGGAETAEIFEVINAAAERYRGVIPAESDTDPYMPMAEVEAEMEEMRCYGWYADRLAGVVGIQERADVSLIRHLYVHPAFQRQGIGTRLLEEALERSASETVLVGTWKAAEWAVAFYERRGFENLGTDVELLSEYWEIPAYQREASVVLRYEPQPDRLQSSWVG